MMKPAYLQQNATLPDALTPIRIGTLPKQFISIAKRQSGFEQVTASNKASAFIFLAQLDAALTLFQYSNE